MASYRERLGKYDLEKFVGRHQRRVISSPIVFGNEVVPATVCAVTPVLVLHALQKERGSLWINIEEVTNHILLVRQYDRQGYERIGITRPAVGRYSHISG